VLKAQIGKLEKKFELRVSISHITLYIVWMKRLLHPSTALLVLGILSSSRWYAFQKVNGNIGEKYYLYRMLQTHNW